MRELIVALVVCLAGQVQAHDLQYTVAQGEAVQVKLFFADQRELSFEGYEIYHEGESIPFQVGRTDALGRLAFMPDRAGTWRIRVFSEGGHGVDLSLTTDAQGVLESAGKPLFERYPRVIVGASIIFGGFGLISLFLRRRRED